MGSGVAPGVWGTVAQSSKTHVVSSDSTKMTLKPPSLPVKGTAKRVRMACFIKRFGRMSPPLRSEDEYFLVAVDRVLVTAPRVPCVDGHDCRRYGVDPLGRCGAVR